MQRGQNPNNTTVISNNDTSMMSNGLDNSMAQLNPSPNPYQRKKVKIDPNITTNILQNNNNPQNDDPTPKNNDKGGKDNAPKASKDNPAKNSRDTPKGSKDGEKNRSSGEQRRKDMREKEIRRVKKISRALDTIAAILAVASLLISYNEQERFYKIIYEDDGVTILKNRNVSDVVCTSLRAINGILTILICIFVIIHYNLRLKILKLQKLKRPEDSLRSSGLLKWLFIELALCIIFIPPYVDFTFSGSIHGGIYVYSLDAIFSVITMGKSYLILRLYAQYSPWTNEKALQICAKHKTQATVGFAIKSELKKRPYLMLAILMIVTIIYLGFAIRTFEISYEPNQGGSFDFSYLANDFWLTIITMTTVGFGDGYPSTHLGRCIGVIACIIGMLLISLMVVSLTVASEFTPEESKAFFILKRIYANDDAKEKAANVIKTIFKLRNVVKAKSGNITVEKFVWLTKLKKQIAVFKNDYRIANSQNLPVDEMLKNLQEKLETDINDIKKEVVAIPELDARCAALRDRQVKISNRLDEIVKIQSAIADYLIKLNQMKRN